MGRNGSRSGNIRRSLAAVAFLVCIGGASASAASPLFTLDNATPALRLVYADTSVWSTDLIVSNGSASPATVTYDPAGCEIGPAPSVTLAPGGSAIVPNFAQSLSCVAENVGTVLAQVSDDLVNVETITKFDDGQHVAFFSFPPLSHNLLEGILSATGIQNDAEHNTDVLFFNSGFAPAPIRIAVFGGDGHLLAIEQIELPVEPPFLDYHLVTQVEAGRLEIEEASQFGCPVGCTPDVPVYGFAAVNWRAGGAPRVIELRPLIFEVSTP
jgi:hypothetical protein